MRAVALALALTRAAAQTLAGMDVDAADGDASLYFGNGLPGTT